MQLLDNASVKIEIYADQVDYSKVDKRKWKPDAKKFPSEIIQKSNFFLVLGLRLLLTFTIKLKVTAIELIVADHIE
jgi:hypothetical protein